MKHIEVDYWTGIKETYLRVNKKEAFKWITIEGIGQRASMDEVCHKLSYMGRILENPVENTWKIEDGEDDYLKDIKNGDISVKMKLDFEVNYLITGMTAYRVNYQGQAKQCGFCFSWKHSRVSECPGGIKELGGRNSSETTMRAGRRRWATRRDWTLMRQPMSQGRTSVKRRRRRRRTRRGRRRTGRRRSTIRRDQFWT